MLDNIWRNKKSSQFARTWNQISTLENFPSSTFLQEFPPKKCGTKLATVMNQPVARPPPTSSATVFIFL